jgi:hypothetical protein
VLLLKGKKERKRREPIIEKGEKTTSLARGKEGRRKRATSLPPLPKRATQRR